ncbi:23310_t:CDS:1, partial [Racocetra persica]
MVNNEKMTLQEQIQPKEFLLKEKNLFAQNLENLDHTNVITYNINT